MESFDVTFGCGDFTGVCLFLSAGGVAISIW